jgi:hypothetical protein
MEIEEGWWQEGKGDGGRWAVFVACLRVAVRWIVVTCPLAHPLPPRTPLYKSNLSPTPSSPPHPPNLGVSKAQSPQSSHIVPVSPFFRLILPLAL